MKEEPDEDGAAASSADVRRADKEDSIKHHEAMLQVRDLKFTHDTVHWCFRDGRSFEDLIRNLRSGQVDPMKDLDPLKVCFWPGHGCFTAATTVG